MTKIVHVLLTGGVGSRLWPLSRKSKPKQYLPLFGNQSLFEKTIHRNRKFCDELFIVGNQSNLNLTKACLAKNKVSNYQIITESVPRNTAPAICFAALSVHPEDILLITPSDHIITENTQYEKAIEKAIHLAENGCLVTFGIQPTHPETGYGYIEFNGENVLSFREKPNEATAKEFLKQNSFLWNSGMFCFKAGVYLSEMEKFAPQVVTKSKLALDTSEQDEALSESASLAIPSISVDYAVMEKSDKIKVVHSDIEWSDMGSFEAVYDFLKQQGHPTDNKGNMVIQGNKPTYFVGLENTIIVNTDDALLILNKSKSQEVKDTYQQLEEEESKLIN